MYRHPLESRFSFGMLQWLQCNLVNLLTYFGSSSFVHMSHTTSDSWGLSIPPARIDKLKFASWIRKELCWKMKSMMVIFLGLAIFCTSNVKSKAVNISEPFCGWCWSQKDSKSASKRLFLEPMVFCKCSFLSFKWFTSSCTIKKSACKPSKLKLPLTGESPAINHVED